jgi:hypothetical protein
MAMEGDGRGIGNAMARESDVALRNVFEMKWRLGAQLVEKMGVLILPG